jgi:hypothetical protein
MGNLMTANIGPDGIGVFWTSTDILRAAALMVAEAGHGASTEHKAAVLSTIQNRAADPNFPTSPGAVMTQRNQYEPVRRYGGIDNIPDANAANLAIAVATLDSYRATSGMAGALDDRHGTVVYFTNPAITAQRGTSHPSAGNIFPEFNTEGHVFTGINTFNASLAPVPNNAPIYSSDAQELVNRVRNTPEYHQALATLDTTTETYAYLAQIEQINVAELHGAHMQIAQQITPTNPQAETAAQDPQYAPASELLIDNEQGIEALRLTALDTILRDALSGLKTETQFSPDMMDVIEPQPHASTQPQQSIGGIA